MGPCAHGVVGRLDKILAACRTVRKLDELMSLSCIGEFRTWLGEKIKGRERQDRWEDSSSLGVLERCGWKGLARDLNQTGSTRWGSRRVLKPKSVIPSLNHQ